MNQNFWVVLIVSYTSIFYCINSHATTFVDIKFFDSLQVVIDGQLTVGDYEEALLLSDRAIQEIPLSYQMADRLAQFYTSKGTSLRYLGDYSNSFNAHSNALKIRKAYCGAQTLDVASAYLNLGNVSWYLGSLEEARQFFESAEKIKQELLGQHHPELAPIFNGLGAIFLEKQAIEKAEDYFERAFQITKNAWPDQPSKFTPYGMNLASLYDETGRLDMALDLLQSLSKLHQAIKQIDYYQLANIYTNWGNLLAELQAFQEAIWKYDAAVQYFQKMPVLPSFEYGNCLQNKGLALLELGELNQAASHFNLALPYLEGDAPGQATVLQHLGLAYLYQGHPATAIEQFSESLLIYESLDPIIYGKESGIVHLNLGSAYLEMPANYAFAKYYFEEAIQRFPFDQYPELYLKSLNKLGNCLIKLKAFDQAGDVFRETEQKAAPQYPFLYGSSLYFQAILALEQSQFETAKQLLAQVLDYLIQLDRTIYSLVHFEIQVHATQALVYKKLAEQKDTLDNWKACLNSVERGISGMELLKNNLADIQSEINLNQDFFRLYDLGIEACYQLKQYDKNYLAKGWQLSEQFKSQVLKQLSAEEKQNTKSDSIEVLESRLADFKIQRFQLPAHDVHKERIIQLNQAILEIENQLGILQPITRGTEVPIKGYEALQNSLGKEETLLEFHWGVEIIFLFIINQDSIQFHQIEDAPEILSNIESLFRWSAQRTEWLGANLQPIVEDTIVMASNSLYQKLIAPYESYLSDKLLIVPDGPLSLIPFDILIRQLPEESYQFRTHSYLIEDYTISYLYPASELLLWKTTKTNNSQQIFAIAPSFEGHSKGLQVLKNNVSEVHNILQRIKGRSLVGELATEVGFKTYASRFDIIHLSTHGILNNEDPKFSYIAFQEKLDSLENEQLFVAEIETLDLDANLVFLSACQSALGKLYRGEGLISMARAFKIAGAKSLIASLWNVDDKQTPEIIESFYDYLGAGMSKSAALRQAKLDYIETTSHPKAHPFYWAGFVLHGNPGTIDLAEKWSWWDWFWG